MRFARAAMAVANMRGKAIFLSVVSAWVSPALLSILTFFQEYLGIRNESVDETEILRRMEEGIYDHEEYAKAMAWTENIASPTKGKTLRTVPKSAKPVKRRMPTGNLL